MVFKLHGRISLVHHVIKKKKKMFHDKKNLKKSLKSGNYNNHLIINFNNVFPDIKLNARL